MILGTTGSFDAAHFLPGHDKCGTVHGHTYHYEVQISGPIHKDGMVVDLHDLKRIVNQRIGMWDHTLLNDNITTPTAENIAYELAVYLVQQLEGSKALSHTTLRKVRVWETDNSYAEWRNNGCR